VQPRIEIVAGTAFEVLLTAASVADVNWRDVFALGQAAYAEALTVVGEDFVRRIVSVGRYGWINLTSLVTICPQPWDLGQLVSTARRCTPEELHFAAIGGDRLQLVEALPADAIRAAIAGDTAARDRLRAAFASDENVLQATSWLLTSPSADVHETILGVLQTWQQRLLPPREESALGAALHGLAHVARTELATTTGRTFLERTIGGVHYRPAGLDRVLMVPSFRVAPIIVVVDGRASRVILYPPLGASPSDSDSSGRLLELCRAVGDKTRLKLLTELRQGRRTAVELSGALAAPRTTLLHHLAMLRAARLIDVTVTARGATVYQLRPEGFVELSRSAADFIPPA
jgi:DNA-binding transcriptional ArsR family regulator